MYLKNMEYIKILFLYLIIQLSGSWACFTNNQIQYTKVKTGSSFYQECRCDEPGTSGVNLKWLDSREKEIVPLGPGTKSNIYSEWTDKDTYSLYISNITKSTSGAYKCGTNHNGQLYTQTYNIEAYDPPYFVNTEMNQYVVSGRDALITCEAKGETEPLIAWYKDGLIEITNDEKYEVIPKGLRIKDITKHDSGVYRCTASDLETGEGIDRDINVEVILAPVITELIATPNSKIAVGESLTIECLASGMPHPEYTWRKVNDVSGRITWQTVANRIVFESVDQADRGEYECTAGNAGGNDSMSIPIQILIPPTITEFKDVTAVEGSTTQIVCKATGQPIPKINMVFLGEDTNEQSIVWDTKNVNDTEVEFYLTFLKVNRTHDGTYICNATNDVDYVSQEMNMSVLYPPLFNKPIEKAWGWSGKLANLSCEHLSNPPAQITWRYHANEVAAPNLVDINKMMADKEHDPWLAFDFNMYGVYECVVENELGKARKLINLQEGFAPPAITNITVVEVTPTSATFAIDGPEMVNGPPLIGYRSEYDQSVNYNVTDIHTNRTWSIDRPYRLDKLKPNTTYFIKFAAVNDVGNGVWSDYVEFDTLERKPAMSPPEEPVWDTNSEEVAKNLMLKWKTLDNGEPIEYYIIKQCLVNINTSGDTDCKQFMVHSTEHPIAVGGSNITYYFEIVAHNALGNSSALHMFVTLSGEEEPLLSAGGVIGLSIVVVFVCLVLLDLVLLMWRRQGILANCCYKKKNKNEESLNSRDKKGLLKEGDNTMRPSNGHKEYEYNKTTGVITGKHSAV